MAEAIASGPASTRAQANARLVAEYLDAWLRMDVEHGSSFYADDLVVHVPGRHELAGTYRGRAAFHAGYVERAFELTGGRWSVESVEDILASESRAMALVNKRFERDGEPPLETLVISVYEIDDDKIVQLWMYDQDPYAVDAFFAREGN